LANLELTRLCGEITETAVIEFERELAATLPEDYREFLIKNNCVRTNPNHFFISRKQGGSLVQYFLGLCDNQRWYSLRYFLEDYNQEVPSNLLPIAPDGGGNLICISIKGEDYGKVYFWDRDDADFRGNPTYENLHLLADDFATFLTQIY